MPYPEELVAPMRKELTDHGVTELKSATEVEDFLGSEETSLVIINSVCGCAAGGARPRCCSLDSGRNETGSHRYRLRRSDVEATQSP